MKSAWLRVVHVTLWFASPTIIWYVLGLQGEANRYRPQDSSEETQVEMLLAGMLLWGVVIYGLHWGGNRSIVRAFIYCMMMILLLLLSLAVAAFVVVVRFGL